jgi:tRNA dimethylallyltransferase
LLVVLLGATASGKTALAIRLAEQFGGEIVSCDSVAVYREMEIGTAKPSQQERARVPHHLLDVIAPNETYTAGNYSRDARAALAEIAMRNRLPIVVGGTGLYLRALLEGLFAGPQRSEELRERLRVIAARRGGDRLAKILARLDPVSAEKIHPNDAPKLIRAIEVTLQARQPMSTAWQAGRDKLQGYRILRLGLDPPREALYARIDARAVEMFDHGLVEETGALLAKYGAECRALGSLGYRQAGMLLHGEVPREEAIRQTQQGHRNYAKRQGTWFRREPEVRWLRGFGDDPAAMAEAAARVKMAKSGICRS